jgi:hypothetical protein
VLFRSTTGQAIRIAQLNADAEAALADIIKITCLIIEEGGECKFIHKSVQEYHAATFVKDQPDELAGEFYRKVRNKWRRWEQELDFLEQTDTYRYYKHFLIPDILETLGFDTQLPPAEWQPSSEEIRLLIDITALGFSKPSQLLSLTQISTSGRQQLSFQQIIRHNFVRGLFDMDLGALREEIANQDSPLSAKVQPFPDRSELVLELKLSEIVEAGCMVERITEIGKAAFAAAHTKLLRAQEYVKQVEATKSILDLGNGLEL